MLWRRLTLGFLDNDAIAEAEIERLTDNDRLAIWLAVALCGYFEMLTLLDIEPEREREADMVCRADMDSEAERD